MNASPTINHHMKVMAGGWRYPPTTYGRTTLYGYDPNFMANSINRYSLGDRSPSLKKDADGATTFYIQADSPGAEKEGNCLPSLKGKPFDLVPRAYVPGPKLLDQIWIPAAVIEMTE